MRALLAVAADHPGAHLAMMSYLTSRGRYAEAESFGERSPMADGPAVLVNRAIIASKLGDAERAAELFRPPAELLASWEAEGLTIPPHGRLTRHFIRGDRAGMLATLHEYWRTGLRWIEDPPATGVYYIDRSPLVEDLLDDPEFQALLAGMRAAFDSLRVALHAEGAG